VRLSFMQKDVLFLLYAIEQKGGVKPVSSMSLLKNINNSRSSGIEESNFRPSCHKLVTHGLIDLHRGAALKLNWKLTVAGREKGKAIYDERLKDINDH
jgi:hypothetical protein